MGVFTSRSQEHLESDILKEVSSEEDGTDFLKIPSGVQRFAIPQNLKFDI